MLAPRDGWCSLARLSICPSSHALLTSYGSLFNSVKAIVFLDRLRTLPEACCSARLPATNAWVSLSSRQGRLQRKRQGSIARTVSDRESCATSPFRKPSAVAESALRRWHGVSHGRGKPPDPTGFQSRSWARAGEKMPGLSDSANRRYLKGSPFKRQHCNRTVTKL
jgi:hypothetical protein